MVRKIAFTVTVIWPLALHGLEKKTVHFVCVLFVGKKLANTAMAPAKLNRQFSINHSHLSNKTVDYFRRLLDSQQKQRKVYEKKVTIIDKAQEASYLVAELVAKKMTSHTIAESLIMHACKIILRTMLGEEAESELSKVPVFDNTISRRVDDLSNNISDILSEILQITTLLSK